MRGANGGTEYPGTLQQRYEPFKGVATDCSKTNNDHQSTIDHIYSAKKISLFLCISTIML